jgi:signal transduction histidine kinase
MLDPVQRSAPAHVASLVANAPLERVLAAAAEALASECAGARALITRRDAVRAGVIEAALERGTARHDAAGTSAVAAAIVVGGAPWGALSVHAATTLPSATEDRAAELAALVAAAVAIDALAATRERILAATDATRRRLERELHDGAQQRLVRLAMELQLAGQPALVGTVEEILEQLRALSRALHPAILTEGGLRPALRALVRRSPVAVRLRAEIDQRFDERVELAVYHVVAEALAGAASVAEIGVELRAGRLRVLVTHDGRGPEPAEAKDRVEALGGALAVERPAGGGTTISAELPP